MGLGQPAHHFDRERNVADAPDPTGIGSVLSRIAGTMDSVPRILLRDSDEGAGDEALVRPHSTEVPTPEPGPSRIRLLGEIARGGMGAILKGRDEDLGRDLAVKVLLETHRGKPELVRRFVEEAQIGGQLQHPGIVPIYELGTLADRRPYFAMKLVRGTTLAELLGGRPRARGETPPAPGDDEAGSPAPAFDDVPRLLQIFEQACQTMAYAHARGVIHRDLKPSNVMVGSFGEVQVMDWGLAKVLPHGGVIEDRTAGRLGGHEPTIATGRSRSAADQSLSGSIMGTPSYMAPEQARGEIESIDRRADVFALGAILCEILTGRPPFTGRTSDQILEKAASCELTEALRLLDGCGADRELVALAKDCLAARPDDRPRDARNVAARVASHLSGVQERLRALDKARAIAEARAADERKRRRLTLALATSIVTLLGVGVGGSAWLGHQKNERREATRRLVDEALDRAYLLRGEAEADESRALVRLGAALAEVERAEGAARAGIVDSSLAARVTRVKETLTRLREETEERTRRASARSALRSSIQDLLLRPADDWGREVSGPSLTPSQMYDRAFRDFGIDLESPRAVEAMRRSELREEFIAALDNWSQALDHDAPERRRNLALADAIDDRSWRRRLRAAIQSRDLEALRRLASDEEALEQSPSAIAWLGTVLVDWGLRAAAESFLKAAQARYPADYWMTYQLGRVLYDAGRAGKDVQRISEAKAYLMTAVAIRPSATQPRFYLAMTQARSGDTPQAIRTLRHVEAMAPTYFWIPLNMGVFLLNAGDLESATEASRRACQLQPSHPWGHETLAHCLLRRGRYADALAAVDEAIRLNGRCEEAQAHRGEILANLERWDEAVATYRVAIEQEPKRIMSRVSLADTLRRLGRHAEALDEYRAARERAAAHPDWFAPMDAWIRRCERAIALQGEDLTVVDDEASRDADDLVALAELSYEHRRYAASARYWARALAMEPRLGESPLRHCRYDLVLHDRFAAACAAAMAGSGLGEDAGGLDARQQTELRQQAFHWLLEELPAEARVLEVEPVLAVSPAREKAIYWQAAPELSTVRDAEGLSRLPEAERARWQSLWEDVARVR